MLKHQKVPHMITLIDVEYEMESAKESLNNTSLPKLDMSKLKTHSVTRHSKSAYDKCKLAQVEKIVAKRIAIILSVEDSELTIDESKSDKDKNNKEIKARELHHLVKHLKKKLETVNRHRKLHILTFVPKSWSIRKAANKFGVSKKSNQKVKKLKEENEIAAYTDFVTRQKLSKEVLLSVKDFYCDDEFSRQLQGKKDYFSIRENQHMSKRLLLCN